MIDKEEMKKMVHDAVEPYFISPGKMFYEIERLRAENEKLREALAAERERCAKIAENIYYPNEGKMIAAAIRESGE